MTPNAASRTVVLASALLLAATAACKPAPAPSASPATGTPNAPGAPPIGDEASATVGEGELRFRLGGDVSLRLPVSYCAGAGTILTVMARDETHQVDLRLVDSERIRNGRPVEDVATVSYMLHGADYQDLWQTKAIGSVERAGSRTTVTGTLTGGHMVATSENSFAPPADLAGGQPVDFRLEVDCRS